MYKISNWLFGSFFRTLGRILVYIFIGYILFNVINIDSIKLPKLDISSILFMNVNADIINPSEGVIIDNTDFDVYRYLGNTRNDIDVTTRIEIFQSSLNAYDYPFLIVDVCATNDISSNRTSSIGSSCTNSCYSNAVGIKKTNLSCTSNGYNGKIYRVFGSIAKWYIGSGNTSIYSVSDRFTFTTNYTGYIPITIYGVYLSSEDYSNEDVNYSSNFESLNNSIANVSSSISSSTNSIISNQNQNKQDIINNQNSNSQAQINNATQNKNDIINNQNSNSQAQIDNANANTDKTIDSQKVCSVIDKNNVVIQDKYLDINGVIYNNTGFGITDYISISSSNILSALSVNSSSMYGASYCFYNINKEKISCSLVNNISVGQEISIPTTASYFRSTIRTQTNQPHYKLCKNGNQATADKLDDLQSSITDSSAPNTGELSNSAGWLPTGPVDGILNLPLSFLTNLNSNLSKSCQPVNLPLPYINKTLELPCVNSLYAQIEGLPVWINSIGIIASAFMLFAYLINLYKYIDDTLTFRENNYIDNWSGV